MDYMQPNIILSSFTLNWLLPTTRHAFPLRLPEFIWSTFNVGWFLLEVIKLNEIKQLIGQISIRAEWAHNSDLNLARPDKHMSGWFV